MPTTSGETVSETEAKPLEWRGTEITGYKTTPINGAYYTINMEYLCRIPFECRFNSGPWGPIVGPGTFMASLDEAKAACNRHHLTGKWDES